MKSMQTITKWAVKWIAGAAVAGALVLAIPHQAQAQSFGVQFGGRPAGYGYHGPARYNGWNRGVYYGPRASAPAYVPRGHYYGWDRYHARYNWRGRY